MGHSLQIFAWGMPLHAHVFSFTHNAVVLSLILDVFTPPPFTPKIRRKFLDFNIFMNQNKRRLHKTWSDR